MLDSFLAGLPPQAADPRLLVGNAARDDGAVYRIADDQAVVATTDFFMPIVDDPRDFGRIAAANALSDIYAMGARPILALAIAGIPLGKIAEADVQAIFAGGIEMCSEAGVALAGGHTIDAPEPLYGLAVVGLVDPARVKTNDGAKSGDALILGKPLGIGILGNAHGKGELDAAGYAELVETATRLNSVGADLAAMPGVHAITDVTGFGLLGHLLEMCAKGLAVRVSLADVPLLPTAVTLAKQGYVTGSGGRNWLSYGTRVTLPDDIEDWQRNLLLDPQTSGGLLVACAEEDVAAVLALFEKQGYPGAARIGGFETGEARVTVA